MLFKNKIFITLLIFSSLAYAGRTKSVKGELISYNNKNFKIKTDRGFRRYDLSQLEVELQANIHKLVGKKIEFNIESTKYYQIEKAYNK